MAKVNTCARLLAYVTGLADANLIMHHGDVNIFWQDLRNVEQAFGDRADTAMQAEIAA